MKKKGGLYNSLSSLIIFGIMLVATIFLVQDIFSGTHNQNDESLKALKSAIENVSDAPLKETFLTLDLDEETALVGFNAGSGSNFQYTFDGFNPTEEKHIFFMKGFYMQRPDKCNLDEACICLCRGYDYTTKRDDPQMTAQDAQIICTKELTCTSIKDVEFKKMKMPEVFDDNLKRTQNLPDAVPKRDTHYWENGFIILRSDKIDNTKSETYTIYSSATGGASGRTIQTKISHPLVVSGYMDYVPLRFIDTIVYTNSNGQVGICLKAMCNITQMS